MLINNLLFISLLLLPKSSWGNQSETDPQNCQSFRSSSSPHISEHVRQESEQIGKPFRFLIGGKISLSEKRWGIGQQMEGVLKNVFSSSDNLVYEIQPASGEVVRVFILDASRILNLDHYREITQ